jgi:hypothetical protein
MVSKLTPSKGMSDSPVKAFHLSDEVGEGDVTRYTAEHDNELFLGLRLKVEEFSLINSKGYYLCIECIHVDLSCWNDYAMVVVPSIPANPTIAFGAGHGVELIANTLVKRNRCYLLALFIGSLNVVLLHRQSLSSLILIINRWILAILAGVDQFKSGRSQINNVILILTYLIKPITLLFSLDCYLLPVPVLNYTTEI